MIAGTRDGDSVVSLVVDGSKRWPYVQLTAACRTKDAGSCARMIPRRSEAANHKKKEKNKKKIKASLASRSAIIGLSYNR